jgi:hypothetical protein
MSQLVNDRQLAKELGGHFTRNKIRRLRVRGLIPFIHLGYRTILFDKERVIEALSRCEVKAVSTRARREKANASAP